MHDDDDDVKENVVLLKEVDQAVNCQHCSKWSAEFNATCALSKLVHRDDSKVPAYFQPINIFFIVFHVLFVISTTIWFFVESKKSLFLKKRSRTAIVTSALGGFLMLLDGPIRNLNPQAYPCDLFLVCLAFANPIVVTPVALRLFQFRNQLNWNRHLAQTSLGKINDAIVHHTNDSTPITTGLAAATDAEISISLAPLRKSVYHGLKSVGVTSNVSAAVASVEDQSQFSGSRMQSITLGLWFRSSVWFSALIFLAVMVIYLLAEIVPFLLLKSYYLHGCVGCLYNWDEDLVTSLAAIFIAVGLVYSAWDIRHEKDPLEVKSEIQEMFAVALPLGSVCIIGLLTDIYVTGGAIEDSGVMEWDWIFVVTVIWMHYSMCPKQILKARKFRTLDGVPSKTDFKELLMNSSFLEKFEAHCVNEFSTENIKFYEAVVDYQYRYVSMKPTERNKIALEIFNVFVPNGSPMQINIKHVVRDPLEQQFLRTHVGVDMPENVFDIAQEEIFELMYTDTFVRFARSSEYRKWADKSVVIKDGIVAVLA